jgi:outer membrane protein assembly factor BamB
VNTGAPIVGGPAVADGLVFSMSSDGHTYWQLSAWEADNGHWSWSLTSVGTISDCSPAVANGVVYVTDFSGNIVSVPISNPSAYNLVNYGDGFFSSPAVHNGVLYVGGFSGTVYALDAATLGIIWANPITPGFPIFSSPAVANGVVYIGSTDWGLYALNAATGAVLPGWPVFT